MKYLMNNNKNVIYSPCFQNLLLKEYKNKCCSLYTFQTLIVERINDEVYIDIVSVIFLVQYNIEYDDIKEFH